MRSTSVGERPKCPSLRVSHRASPNPDPRDPRPQPLGLASTPPSSLLLPRRWMQRTQRALTLSRSCILRSPQRCEFVCPFAYSRVQRERCWKEVVPDRLHSREAPEAAENQQLGGQPVRQGGPTLGKPRGSKARTGDHQCEGKPGEGFDRVHHLASTTHERCSPCEGKGNVGSKRRRDLDRELLVNGARIGKESYDRCGVCAPATKPCPEGNPLDNAEASWRGISVGPANSVQCEPGEVGFVRRGLIVRHGYRIVWSGFDGDRVEERNRLEKTLSGWNPSAVTECTARAMLTLAKAAALTLQPLPERSPRNRVGRVTQGALLVRHLPLRVSTPPRSWRRGNGGASSVAGRMQQ